MKGLSFASAGTILYVVFSMKGYWPASIGTSLVTKVIPLLILCYVFDLIARKISEWPNNELGGYDDTSFVYDDNGNMVQKTDNGVVTNYIYNLEVIV